jgi:hypothetical protein
LEEASFTRWDGAHDAASGAGMEYMTRGDGVDGPARDIAPRRGGGRSGVVCARSRAHPHGTHAPHAVPARPRMRPMLHVDTADTACPLRSAGTAGFNEIVPADFMEICNPQARQTADVAAVPAGFIAPSIGTHMCITLPHSPLHTHTHTHTHPRAPLCEAGLCSIWSHVQHVGL